MLIPITLPADQTEGTESVMGTWFKQVGQPVTENEPLLEIATDKVTVEIAAPATGVLQEILKQEGDPVEPGEVVGRIAAGADAGSQAAATRPVARELESPDAVGAAGSTAAATEELSPAVRRLLREHRLDPAAIRGTGRGGRITVQDVEGVIAGRTEADQGREGRTEAVGGGQGRTGIPSRRVPHNLMRRSVAEHMARSLASAPHVTSVFEADCSALLAHRDRHRADAERDGVRLTYTAYFVRAAVEAIRAVPQSNARWHDDALEMWEDVNVGIATALESGGLIVPVVRKAQDLDLRATAKTIQDLTERARAGKLDPRDVQQGTFTISNHGVSGSLIAAPIVLNQPQSAILGIGKLQERAVVIDGKIVVRPMLYVTLTIDHRVLDGNDANRWLTRFVEVLEGWPSVS